MLIYLACSKTMTDKRPGINVPKSIPPFNSEAIRMAKELDSYNAVELQHILHVNGRIAAAAKMRYHDFENPSMAIPAIFAYTGTAYKALDARTLSSAELERANNRLTIGSFLYGLLRPFDLIHPYRLEGDVTLPSNAHETLFEFWPSLLTESFIAKVKADGGKLLNLSSSELCRLMDWKKICKEVEVVTPTFKIDRGERSISVAMYAKMCRGAMTRWVIQNNIESFDDLRQFEFRGFVWKDGYDFELSL